MDERCLTNSQAEGRVLVHGRKKRAERIDSLTKANFSESVHRAMSELRLQSVYPTQSVAWPHILRGNSMVLIDETDSGKTMSYLPAICSIVQEHVEETSTSVGPVAIILCASSSKVVFDVARLCRLFVSDNVQVVEGFGERSINRTVPLLLNGCGILVCTISNLSRLLNFEIDQKQKLFDKRRIRHLVFDDIDLIAGRFSSELKFVMELFCSDLNRDAEVQIVVTARHWCHKFNCFYGLGMNPILCFGDFFEAAMYAGCELQLQRLPSTKKVEQAITILFQLNYMENRTIVVCNHSAEVQELVCRLKELSITPAYCDEKSSDDENSTAKSWNREAPPGQNTVFVCTDKQLGKVDIRLAQNIIHYSLPSDWRQFSNRYASMSDYFEDFFVKTTPNRAPPFSLVLLDNDNNQQLPRLIDSMLVHNFTDINDEILQFAQEIRQEFDEKRRVKLISFCPNILLVGECINIACKYRHILTYSDRSVDSLPRIGRIKVKILDCHSPSHYSVKILERLFPGEKKWVRVSSDYRVFNLNFQNHYADAMNHWAHIPVLKGDMCVLSPQSHTDYSYKRCKVVRVDSRSKKVTVRLIDEGISLTAICTDDLLQLDAEFNNFPSQAVDLRLANLVPYDHDMKWDRDSMANVKHWLKKGCMENAYIEGTIQWSSCLNTIWVDTLRLSEKTKTDVLVLSIRDNLLAKKFGIEDNQCLSMLQIIAASLGIRDDQPSQRVNAVATTSCQVERKVEVAPTVDRNRGKRMPSKLMRYLLSPRSSSSASRRASSSELNESVADVIGDSNDRWVQVKPNIFQSVAICTFHTPWQFYLQVLSPELYKLYESIDDYISKRSNQRRIYEDLTIGMMCLCKAYGEYNRAKIMDIKCVPERGMMITVFFVDFGLRSVIHMHDLLKIPKYLVDKEPFQAIQCSLVGIRPTENASDWDRNLCDQMYERFLKPCEKMAIWTMNGRRRQPDLNIWTYDCILVDMNDDYQTSSLNDQLVLNKLADYDPVDQYHLTAIRNVIPSKILDSDDDSKSWDVNDDQRSQEADADHESQNSDYSFTDNKIKKTKRSLVSDRQELLGTNTFEYFETKISNNKCELDRDNESESEPLQRLEQSESDLYSHDIPALMYPAAVPNVMWEQSNSEIILMIQAPAVTDYYIRVTDRFLQFSCLIAEVPHVLHMHFLGSIDTKYSSHEMRGVFVYVLLKKTFCGAKCLWPRLMADNDSYKWLKYNAETFSLAENPNYPFMNRSKHRHRPFYLDSDDSSDSDHSYNSDSQLST